MASLTKLVQKSVPTVIDFGDGDVVKARFKPHENLKAEAEDLQQRLETAEDDAATKAEAYQTFCRTFTEWDLEDDGKTIPLTPEGLAAAMGGQGVPPSLLTAFIIRAFEDYYSFKQHGRKR